MTEEGSNWRPPEFARKTECLKTLSGGLLPNVWVLTLRWEGQQSDTMFVPSEVLVFNSDEFEGLHEGSYFRLIARSEVVDTFHNCVTWYSLTVDTVREVLSEMSFVENDPNPEAQHLNYRALQSILAEFEDNSCPGRTIVAQLVAITHDAEGPHITESLSLEGALYLDSPQVKAARSN